MADRKSYFRKKTRQETEMVAVEFFKLSNVLFYVLYVLPIVRSYALTSVNALYNNLAHKNLKLSKFIYFRILETFLVVQDLRNQKE